MPDATGARGSVLSCVGAVRADSASPAGGRPSPWLRRSRHPAVGAAAVGAARRGGGRRSGPGGGIPARGRLRGRARVRGDRARLALRRARQGGARRRDRAPHQRAETRAVGARDRAGRDRAAAVDGGRVQRRGHRRAHRADRALLGAAGRTHRHGRGLLRDGSSHAAPLHDVGKVAIPDAILLKPGPLTPEERAIVETHAEEGHRLRARLVLLDPRHGGDDRAEPPGEVGRNRLPARA